MPGEVKRSPMRHSEDRRWGWVCHRGEFITSLPPRIEPLPGPGTPQQTHTHLMGHTLHISQQQQLTSLTLVRQKISLDDTLNLFVFVYVLS